MSLVLRDQFHPFNSFLHENRALISSSIERYKVGVIVSGGQTGVDTAAFNISDQLNIPRTGFAAIHFINESGLIPEKFRKTMITQDSHRAFLPEGLIVPPEVISQEVLLPESARYKLFEQRTRLNALFSSATLIVATSSELFGGTLITLEAASQPPHTERDCHILALDNLNESTIQLARDWIKSRKPALLNIAGPRESEHRIKGESIQLLTERILLEILLPTSKTDESPK